MSEIVLTERDGDILLVTLNRPEQYNALNTDLLHALTGAWQLAADPKVRAVVVTGAGRGFCAGADLRAQRPASGSATSGLRHTYNPHILGLAQLEKPVIAAVNGAVAGAGLAIAFAADIRIASDRAKFVPAFAQIGLVPDSGASYFIPRLLGYSRAFDWLSSGRTLSATEAHGWGLINELVPAEELLQRATERAKALAELPGAGIALTKRALNYASHRNLLEQLELEVELQPMAVNAPGRAEARARMIERLKSPH